MAMTLIIFQILAILLCLEPLASSGKCAGKWAIHACGGGNGKRSEIGDDREDQPDVAGIPPREGGPSRLRDVLDPRQSTRRVPHNLSPKQFGYGFRHLHQQDIGEPLENRREESPIWRERHLASSLTSGESNMDDVTNNDDNQELDNALQKIIEKLRRVQQSNAGENDAVENSN